MAMKLFRVVTQELEAQLISGLLFENSIENSIVGAREYASIYAGGSGSGRYEIHVDEELFDLAKEIIEKREKSQAAENNPIVRETAKLNISPSSYFKRAVFFALVGAVIFPIFNLYSLYHAYMYRHTKLATNTSAIISANIIFLLLFLLNVAAVMSFVYISGIIFDTEPSSYIQDIMN